VTNYNRKKKQTGIKHNDVHLIQTVNTASTAWCSHWRLQPADYRKCWILCPCHDKSSHQAKTSDLKFLNWKPFLIFLKCFLFS